MRKHAPGSKKRVKIHAHVNPLSDAPYDFPLSPQDMDWSKYFPEYFSSLDIGKVNLDNKIQLNNPSISWADVGCGFGSLLIELSKLYPNKLGVGLEIRDKAINIVKDKLNKNKINNVSVIHTNAMRFIIHYFPKHSLEYMFFCFPDPHFKKSNVKRRIISVTLLDIYAYLLKYNGRIYNITDVKDLYDWTVEQFSIHPLFERLSNEELEDDPILDLISNKTDESIRVTKNNGNKYYCVYKRLPNPEDNNANTNDNNNDTNDNNSNNNNNNNNNT